MPTLPVNLEVERMILGAILLDPNHYHLSAGWIERDQFSLAKHRRIYRAIEELAKRGETPDRVTVAEELIQRGELEACDGLSYLASLDDGLPKTPSIDAYCQILREKALLRKAILAAQLIQDQCLKAERDPQEILAHGQQVFGTLAQESAQQSEWMSLDEILKSLPMGLGALLSPPDGGWGLPTPWRSLSNALAGFKRGDLVVLGGRPSMGKSAVMGELATHIAGKGHGVAIFSIEMTKENLLTRMIAARAQVNYQHIQLGTLGREERRRCLEAAAYLAGLPLYINEKARSAPQIESSLRSLMVQKPVQIAMTDYLQLMVPSTQYRNQVEEVGAACHHMKRMARDLNICQLLLSQLSRACEQEEREPKLSDLRSTGDIEQDADVVLFVHRPERYRKKPANAIPGETQLIIAKQRNGPLATVRLMFEKRFQKFVELHQGEPDGSEG